MSCNEGRDKINEAWVKHTAALMGLSIAPERLPSVTATMQRIQQIAETVNQVELGPTDELAPVWKP
jgi:Asp-tRNA(Asn)/Glu-tRNA(Gln) amidotransferase C subunit